jgi:hypothetical protein
MMLLSKTPPQKFVGRRLPGLQIPGYKLQSEPDNDRFTRDRRNVYVDL